MKKNCKATFKRPDQGCQLLRKMITAGQFSTEGLIPSVRNLAAELGLERNSIWRALLQLKDERYVVSTPTGRYQVHPRFKLNIPGRKKLNIAFVGAKQMALESPFMQHIFNTLMDNQDGFNINLTLLRGTEEKKVLLAELREYDAVVLSVSWSFDYFLPLRRAGVPVTSLMVPHLYHLPCNVRINNFRGGELAGQIMAKASFERVTLLGESQYYPESWHEDYELRTLGFKKVWLQAGRDSRHIYERLLPINLMARLRGIEKIVATQQEPTGYVALSDATALMLLGVLAEKGISVPEQAAVIGYDDIPEAKDASLSSVAPNINLMAEKIILQLRTLEVEPNYTEIIYVDQVFIERLSCPASKLEKEANEAGSDQIHKCL